jgi:hypothetical protein
MLTAPECVDMLDSLSLEQLQRLLRYTAFTRGEAEYVMAVEWWLESEGIAAPALSGGTAR